MDDEVKARRDGRSTYHHGDLRTTLVDTAILLIGEHGTQGFSLAEAARQAGVSISAPYRHFADRDALLAAVAVRAYEALAPRFEAAVAEAPGDPTGQLARAASAYVRFAVEERALFAVTFGAGLDKSRYPDIGTATTTAFAGWLTSARALVHARDDDAATDLAIAVVSVAHGHAALLSDGQFGDAADHVDDVAGRADAAVRALVRGRRLLVRTGEAHH